MSDKYPFKIIKYWSSNNQKNNVTINVPKKFVSQHKLLEAKHLILTSLSNGILIQPLKEIKEIK